MDEVQRLLLTHPGAGLLLVALLAFLEYIVPPVPGDSTMLLACFLAATGTLSWTPVLLACMLGSIAGSAGAYAIGARLGRSYFFLRSAWAGHELARLERGFRRYGPRLILVNRFLPGVRAVFLYAAGMGGLGWRVVLIDATISNLLWVALIAWGGRSLGSSWAEVSVVFKRYVWSIALLIGVYVTVTIVAARRRARLASVTSVRPGGV